MSGWGNPSTPWTRRRFLAAGRDKAHAIEAYGRLPPELGVPLPGRVAAICLAAEDEVDEERKYRDRLVATVDLATAERQCG
jgi:hypothetical protein